MIINSIPKYQCSCTIQVVRGTVLTLINFISNVLMFWYGNCSVFNLDSSKEKNLVKLEKDVKDKRAGSLEFEFWRVTFFFSFSSMMALLWAFLKLFSDICVLPWSEAHSSERKQSQLFFLIFVFKIQQEKHPHWHVSKFFLEISTQRTEEKRMSIFLARFHVQLMHSSKTTWVVLTQFPERSHHFDFLMDT